MKLTVKYGLYDQFDRMWEDCYALVEVEVPDTVATESPDSIKILGVKLDQDTEDYARGIYIDIPAFLNDVTACLTKDVLEEVFVEEYTDGWSDVRFNAWWSASNA
jgi:hypothetical protein